jgi:uncharacterized membrane protein
VLSKALKKMMAETQEALTKRDEKRRRKKEATTATFIDLTKQAIMVEAMAKLLVEENQIMSAGLSIMELEQRAWFEKK